MKRFWKAAVLSAWLGVSGAALAQLPSYPLVVDPSRSAAPTMMPTSAPPPLAAPPLSNPVAPVNPPPLSVPMNTGPATIPGTPAPPPALPGTSNALPPGNPVPGPIPMPPPPFNAHRHNAPPIHGGPAPSGTTIDVIKGGASDHAPASGVAVDGPSGSDKRGVLAGNPFDAADHILPSDGPFRVYGWLNGGYVYNANNPSSKFNGPYNSIDRANEGMGNQAYLVLEKPLGNCEGIDFGFRADLLYGYDYLVGQSRGFELRPDASKKWNGNQYYGFAIPQAYAEVGNKDVSVKVGHFYSLVGYEGLASAGNFFYSHSYSYQFAGPFTHWGAIGSVRSGGFSVEAGVVNGWNALDRESDQANFMGRVRWADEDNIVAVSFAVITGNEETLTTSPLNRNRTRYSFLVDVNPTCDLQYVFHHWMGSQDDGKFRSAGFGPVGAVAAPVAATGPSTGVTALWYGIDQYVYYRLSDCLKAGLRFEWFRDEDGTRVGLNRPANPNKRPFAGNFYSATFGLNYAPMRNVIVRPEVRYDAQGGGRPAFDDGAKKNQFTSGLDVIVAF